MSESKDDAIYNRFAKILLSICGIVLAALIAPEILRFLLGGQTLYSTDIWSIVIFVLAAIIYVFKNIYKLLTDKEILSAKYGLLISILSIPTVILAHKAIIWIKKPSQKEYGRQN